MYAGQSALQSSQAAQAQLHAAAVQTGFIYDPALPILCAFEALLVRALFPFFAFPFPMQF